MASMIHQNGMSESGSKTGLMIGETSLRSLVGGAFVPVARGTSAPPRKRPPPNNMGGKPVRKGRGAEPQGLASIGLNAKVSVKGAGAAHFKGFVLYQRDTDSYYVRMRTAGAVVRLPQHGDVFESFEAAAMGKPTGEAGWEVLVLYEAQRKFVVLTI